MTLKLRNKIFLIFILGGFVLTGCDGLSILPFSQDVALSPGSEAPSLKEKESLALKAPEETEKQAPAEQKEIKEEEDSVFLGEILTEKEVGDVESLIDYSTDNRMAVHYPRFWKTNIDKDIDDFVEESIQRFEAETAQVKAEKEQAITSLIVDFSSYLFQERYVSIIFKAVKTGSVYAHPTREYSVRYYDLQEDRKVSLADVLEAGYLETLSAYCDAYLRNEPNYGEKIKLDEKDTISIYKEGIAPTEKNYKNVLLKKDGIEVLFERYQIFSGSEGEVVIFIPYDKIDLRVRGHVPLKAATVEEKIQEVAKMAPEKRQIDPAKPMVALTFDDGPHPKLTPALLEILKENEANATFFVLGNRVKSYGKVLIAAYEDGNEIGNHTFNHPQLTKLNPGNITHQISLTDEAIEKLIPVKPALIRPPYGAVNANVLKALDKPAVLWSIDTMDWKFHDTKHIEKEILSKVKDGDIILMHDIHKTTVDACRVVIPVLKERGFQLVTVSEMMEAKGISVKAGEKIRKAR